MAVSRKQMSKGCLITRYVFAFLVLAAGLFLENYNLGKEFLGFSSVGIWMIYVGFVMLAIITLQAISRKRRIVDERMEMIAFKASRVTFIMIILAAFVVMIIDGIKSIAVPYSLFMSYIIMYLVLIYLVAYKILERFY